MPYGGGGTVQWCECVIWICMGSGVVGLSLGG